MPVNDRGRRAAYCSPACRVRAHRARTAPRPRAIPAASTAAQRISEAGPVVLAWNPPSDERPRCEPTTEPCPDCGEPVVASRRRTTRGCAETCKRRVDPAGVLKPYENEDGRLRRVRSQAERDSEALVLAERTGLLLEAIRVALADDRLHVTTRVRLQWYDGEIREAGKAGRGERVDELAERLAGERIRRQHWWSSDGPALAASSVDDVLDADLDEDEGLSRLAIAAGSTVDFTAEMDARSWRFYQPGDGRCQICREDGSECPGRAEHVITGGAICGRHHDALSIPFGRRP